jgi:hypothetical protein
MRTIRDIASALRAAAVWLLVMSVFFGPAGNGAASAFGVDAKPCADSCPCDEPQEAEHDDCDDEGHDGETPADDECPEDCRGCSCAPALALTLVAWAVPASPLSSPALASAPSDAASTGVGTGVFRPPRSRI